MAKAFDRQKIVQDRFNNYVHKEKGGIKRALASVLGVSIRTIENKINGSTPITNEEYVKIIRVFDAFELEYDNVMAS